MVVTYRNNRLIPAILIAFCIVAVFLLVDPSVENYGKTQRVTDNEAPSPAVAAPLQSPSSQPHAGENQHSQPSSPTTSPAEPITDDDILLIVKTGGTSMWKRLLVHLTTTLSPTRISPANIVIYSDMPETIGPFTVVDVFANLSSSVKESPDFEHYRLQPEYQAHNAYVEAAGVEGDDWGPPGGWVIDKYKFVPLMQHAGEHWPDVKWYVYMEDDTYLFLPSVRRYLAHFDWRESHYLGSYAAKTGVVFAHGGAGFALSRGAWEASFGAPPKNGESSPSPDMTASKGRLEETYHQYTADHCCGDQVLAKALADHGVQFGENGGDGKFTWGFNPLVHWAFAFSRYNWCSPLMSWHKVHNRDVAQYYEFEKSWDFSKPLLHRDFFTNMILPRIQSPAQWWDNRASLFEVTSANQAWAPTPEDKGTYHQETWTTAWESVEACEAACRGWAACVSWTFVEDLCRMDDKLALGQGFASAMSQRKTSLMHTSGWVPERLEEWLCE